VARAVVIAIPVTTTLGKPFPVDSRVNPAITAPIVPFVPQ
jgi:hypothetical protein